MSWLVSQLMQWWYSSLPLNYTLQHVWSFCCVINENKLEVKRQFSAAMVMFLCWQFSEPDINHPDMWDPLCNGSLQTSQIFPASTEGLSFVISLPNVLDCWFKLDETLNLMPTIFVFWFCLVVCQKLFCVTLTDIWKFQLKAWLMKLFKSFSSCGGQDNPVTPSDEHN